MTDLFANPDDWEQSTPREAAANGRRYAYDSLTGTWWAQKPTPEPYTPSPEAKALLASLFGHHQWDEADHPHIVDLALAAARQQGRDEGRRWFSNRLNLDARANDEQVRVSEIHNALTPIKNSQGAGLTSLLGYRDESLNVSPPLEDDGDGSTVASPLRGPKDPPLLEADVLDAHKWAALFIEQFPTLDPGYDDNVTDVTVWFANAIQVGRNAGYADGLGAIPEGKVLVDRELVEKARRLLGRAILDGCPGHLQSTGLTGHHASGGCGDRAEADGLASDAYKQLRTESLEGED